MPDYKKMYHTMFKASEAAIELLIAAQQECEELYVSAPEPKITLMESLKGSDTASDTPR